MQIATREVYDVRVVDMSGKQDTGTSGEASDQLVKIVQSDIRQIVLNLDKLDYVSSAGLRIILRTSKLLQGGRGELTLCHANDVVKEVLETSGL